MIARPKISRNEWRTAEIGAFEVGNFALLSCPGHTHLLVAAVHRDQERHWSPEELSALREKRFAGIRQAAEAARAKFDALTEKQRKHQGSTRERNSQLQRLISRPFSTRFG